MARVAPLAATARGWLASFSTAAVIRSTTQYTLHSRESHESRARRAGATCVRRTYEVAKRLILTVRDDGCGMPLELVAGPGMRGMQERVAGLGGSYATDGNIGLMAAHSCPVTS
jgi:glucose-6-phosphate-specific signal transduction histidine kinase